ncbi:MAG: Gfo/Idh/MocA family oxidoreductase [Acetobacteraceae bacterium]|nr:Gfo/Idh/MocA family oxidoreductase [Acetobacteraceae bacterium]
MAAMAQIGLGVLGAGIMGERLLRAAADQDAVTVVGVWDPSEAARDRLAAAMPGLPILPGAAEIIAASDCVYVASPPATHLPHARAVLAAGKALFCEKPLAVDVGAAERFVAQAASARAAVNFPFASAPAAAALAAWLAGTKPRAASIAVDFATWPRGWQSAAAGWLDGRDQGGFTREVVSHFLFLAQRLFGPLRLETAAADFPEPGRTERRIAAQLCAGEVPVSLHGGVGTTEADDSNSFTVDEMFRLRDWSIAERKRGGVTWEPDPAAIPQDRARPLVLHRQLASVAAMTRGEPHGLATLQEALDVQRAVEAILAS